MYEIKSIKAVKRDVKKLPADVLNDIETVHFKSISQNPFQSHELGYAFKGLRSYHFNHRGTSYEILYEVFEEDSLVVIIMIAPRESLYEKLKRRVM